MEQNKSSYAWHKILTVSIGMILVLLALCLWWLTSGGVSEAKKEIYQATAFPVALVDGSPILMRDYLQKLQLAKILESQATGVKLQVEPQNLLAKMAEDKKMEQLAAKLGLTVSAAQVEKEYQISLKAVSNDPTDILNKLSTAGLDETFIKNEIIRPQLLKVALEVWYNGQKNFNPVIFQIAETLKVRLNEGESMETLAKIYTQDTNKALGGDLGFVELYQVWPELQEQLDAAAIGEVKVLPSRKGLHLIRVEDKDSGGQNGLPRLHLRQIFLQTEGFENWYQNQVQNYRLIQIINI